MSSAFPPASGSGNYEAGQTAYNQPVGGGQPPNNYLLLAILSVFCCTPLGVAAIIFATQVNAKWNANDQVGAQAASKKAKMFAIISIVVVLVVVLPLSILNATAGN